MDGRESSTWKAMVLCVLIQATAPALSVRLIVNYDDNLNLRKAMEYDLTVDSKIFLRPDGRTDIAMYRSYVGRASRELAEKHYLAYLDEIKEPWQRARVYAKLSDLYSGNVRHEVAPDGRRQGEGPGILPKGPCRGAGRRQLCHDTHPRESNDAPQSRGAVSCPGRLLSVAALS